MKDKYIAFMLESNRIEGEDRLNPGDIKAVKLALEGINTIDDILRIHQVLGEYLQKAWVGKFRACNVRVGRYRPPHYKKVSELMDRFITDLVVMDSWEAHNEFERVHPFQDLNGRTGRLIWLSKAVNEGYDFSIPFLQAYYYQTLSIYERKKGLVIHETI